ncbi:hypothetical protein AVEN_210027-1 [Araneus ventricosus]|uniref:Uncharacterized protein n=1 Tax=Araneus ventricosus TaxID=182803 RepID=A0A4Y2R4Q7_ARAVE|nr:hypothetical protein AVEN_210027-1 [Araneus ventricosus]
MYAFSNAITHEIRLAGDGGGSVERFLGRAGRLRLETRFHCRSAHVWDLSRAKSDVVSKRLPVGGVEFGEVPASRHPTAVQMAKFFQK